MAPDQLLQPVAIGIGKPGRRRPAPRGSAAPWPTARRGRAVARAVRFVLRAAAAACGGALAARVHVETGRRAARACWRDRRCAIGRGPRRWPACAAGTPPWPDASRENLRATSRSLGCRWPSSMNLASSASEIGPNCWPSRARYHCIEEAGADMSVTGAGPASGIRGGMRGSADRPLCVVRDSNSSAPWRQSSRKTKT